MPLGPEPEIPAGMTQPPRQADCPLDTIDPDPVTAPVASNGVAVVPAYVPQASRPASTVDKKKKAKRKRCPKLRRKMSRKRRAAVKRCRRAQRRRAAARRG